MARKNNHSEEDLRQVRLQMSRPHRKTIVYAAGVWDMFHVGHMNLLKAAKALGDVLIVGVSTDELVYSVKGHHPLLNYEDRSAVVASCRYVDAVVPQRSLEKDEQLEKLDADVLVVGDDWWDQKVRGHEFMVSHGRRVVYFPYTGGRSSSMLRDALIRYYNEQKALIAKEERRAGRAADRKKAGGRRRARR